jgi:uncharacterized membrane protein (Fun14 family)
MASDAVGMNFLIAFGGSSLAGFLSGYALNKALKIIAFAFGLFFAGLAYLQYSKNISVNWDQISNRTQEIAVQAANKTSDIIHQIGASTNNTVDNGGIGIGAATVGFVIGFGLGVKKG